MGRIAGLVFIGIFAWVHGAVAQDTPVPETPAAQQPALENAGVTVLEPVPTADGAKVPEQLTLMMMIEQGGAIRAVGRPGAARDRPRRPLGRRRRVRLEDRSSRPCSSPRQTPVEVEDLIEKLPRAQGRSGAAGREAP